MLRYENDKFLDDVTTTELQEKLNIKLRAVNNSGQDFVDALLGIEEE